jgi:hypothetical protein
MQHTNDTERDSMGGSQPFPKRTLSVKDKIHQGGKSNPPLSRKKNRIALSKVVTYLEKSIFVENLAWFESRVYSGVIHARF